MDPILIKYKYQDLLSLAAMQGKDVYENEFNRLSNLKVYRQDKPSIQSIFATYWDTFKLHFSHLLRPAIMNSISPVFKHNMDGIISKVDTIEKSKLLVGSDEAMKIKTNEVMVHECLTGKNSKYVLFDEPEKRPLLHVQHL